MSPFPSKHHATHFLLISLLRCFIASLFPLLRSPRHNNQRQPNQKARKHRRNITIRSFRRIAEFLPDKHAPERRHHRRSLSQSIRNRKRRPPRRDNVERHSNAPDNPAQNSRQVRAQSAPEVIPERDWRADKRLLHDERAQNKIAQEYADRKNENCRVRPQLPLQFYFGHVHHEEA